MTSTADARAGDRAQIAEALYHYCRAIDRIRPEALLNCFHADALIDNGQGLFEVDAFAAMVVERHAAIPQAFHMIGNILVDFTGADTAFVESYCLAMEHHPGAAQGQLLDRIVRVRYADQFERRDGAWKVARRLVVIDHEMAFKVDPDVSPFAGVPKHAGVRGLQDPVEQLRRSLGLLY